MPKFKIGDRVRTTDFPIAVDEDRGHRIGDIGTIVAESNFTDERWVVQFDPTPDRFQGMFQHGFDNCWTCREDILEHVVQVTPELLQQAVVDLSKLLQGLSEESA